jgi:hypothetical protein
MARKDLLDMRTAERKRSHFKPRLNSTNGVKPDAGAC